MFIYFFSDNYFFVYAIVQYVNCQKKRYRICSNAKHSKKKKDETACLFFFSAETIRSTDQVVNP